MPLPVPLLRDPQLPPVQGRYDIEDRAPVILRIQQGPFFERGLYLLPDLALLRPSRTAALGQFSRMPG